MSSLTENTGWDTGHDTGQDNMTEDENCTPEGTGRQHDGKLRVLATRATLNPSMLLKAPLPLPLPRPFLSNSQGNLAKLSELSHWGRFSGWRKLRGVPSTLFQNNSCLQSLKQIHTNFVRVCVMGLTEVLAGRIVLDVGTPFILSIFCHVRDAEGGVE